MGDRKLITMKMGQPTTEACLKSNFKTVKDVLSRTRGELVQVLDMTTSDVDDMLDTICQRCCPAPNSVITLMESKRENGGGFLSTGMPDLDGGWGQAAAAAAATRIRTPALGMNHRHPHEAFAALHPPHLAFTLSY